VRDYAQVRAGGDITKAVAREALALLDVDEFGLDDMDARILRTIIERFDGGPVGVQSVAAAIGEDPDTIEEVYERSSCRTGSCSGRDAVASHLHRPTGTSASRRLCERKPTCSDPNLRLRLSTPRRSRRPGSRGAARRQPADARGPRVRRDRAPPVSRHRRPHPARRRAGAEHDEGLSGPPPGERDSGAAAEVLLLKPLGDDRWEAMVHPGGKLKAGRRVHVSRDLDVEVLETTERGTRIVRLHTAGDARTAIERHGHVPLPPYITRADTAEDAERYQTVYATESGSVAAPTAGLHFTPAILAALEAKGVLRADVLLHVGAGTFKPVETEDALRHVMHEEWFRVAAVDAKRINDARSAGGRVWAVGTTTLRTLETVADERGRLRPLEGETRLFIHPPYISRAADRLVTNFHLPRSTLLMLVAAFAGADLMREAYATAVREQYRSIRTVTRW